MSIHYNIHNYIPMTAPKSITLKEIPKEDLQHIKSYSLDKIHKNFYLMINEKYVTVTIRNSDGKEVTERVVITNRDLAIIKNTLSLFTSDEEFPLDVDNFEYNGFYGKKKAGKAPYTVKFLKWTNDPGVALVACSDGKERLIPTFALPRWSNMLLPQPDPATKMAIFGYAAHS